jgi:hypothetical protein
MNFWNLNKNEKPENTMHSVGLEFGPRPGTVGPTQRLFRPGRPGHLAQAWRAERDHHVHGHLGGAAGTGSPADPELRGRHGEHHCEVGYSSSKVV